MPKRFTDTQIWEKEWFMKLSPRHKCLWRYLTERCDQSGVWEPNWQLASIYIGESVSKDDLKQFGNHIETLPTGKVFIPDFINFQYGNLSENSPAHKPIFRAIQKNNLSNRVFNRVSNTLQEKEEEKEEDKEKEIFTKKAKIQNDLTDALDDLYLDTIAINWGHIDFKQELASFRDKVTGAPETYNKHGPEGIRSAFIAHLRSARKVFNKPNVTGTFNQ